MAIHHVVLLKLDPDAAAADVDAALEAARGLAGDVPGLLEVVAGPDVSVEGLADGFTHALFMRFTDAAARDGFFDHPAHTTAQSLLVPLLQGALVVDVATR
jgi:hypothetical protein